MRSKNNKEAIIFEHDHILLAINFIKLKKKNAHRKSIKKFANLYNNILKLDQLDEKEFKQFKHPFIVLSFFISNKFIQHFAENPANTCDKNKKWDKNFIDTIQLGIYFDNVQSCHELITMRSPSTEKQQ